MSSSIVRFWWVLKFSTFDLEIRDTIYFLHWIFLGVCVYLWEEIQYPFSFTFSCTHTAPPPYWHPFCLFLPTWALPSFPPHCRVRGGFYWFGSWPCCGISTVLWKPTQKQWFETTVFYFAHRYKVSSAQPGLPLLDSLWGCLQDRRPGVSDGTGLEDSHNWDYWAVPSGGFFTEWPLKSRTPVEDCQLLSVAFSAVPQSGPHLCLSEGEGKGAPLFPRSIRESADLF